MRTPWKSRTPPGRTVRSSAGPQRVLIMTSGPMPLTSPLRDADPYHPVFCHKNLPVENPPPVGGASFEITKIRIKYDDAIRYTGNLNSGTKESNRRIARIQKSDSGMVLHVRQKRENATRKTNRWEIHTGATVHSKPRTFSGTSPAAVSIPPRHIEPEGIIVPHVHAYGTRRIR